MSPMKQTFLHVWNAAGGGDDTDIQVRFYRLFCAIATGMAFLIIIPANLLQNLSPLVNVAVGCFGMVTAFFYLEAQKGHHYTTLFYLLLVLVINITWFVNGGAQGSVASFFVSAFMYAMIIFRGKARWWWLIAFLANTIMLLMIDHAYPQYIHPFQSPVDRLIDLTTGVTISALMCVIVLWTILHSYDRKQLQLATLNQHLETSLAELEKSLAEISTLEGLLPICSWCKNIRNDDGSWTRIEEYVEARTDASFSHGMCPDCYEQHYPELYQSSQQRKNGEQGAL